MDKPFLLTLAALAFEADAGPGLDADAGPGLDADAGPAFLGFAGDNLGTKGDFFLTFVLDSATSWSESESESNTEDLDFGPGRFGPLG